MEIFSWKKPLQELPLGGLYLYQELGSTNLEAELLIKAGAPPFSIVLADSQTEGMGRYGRQWVTRPGKALAFSWILYPDPGIIEPDTLGRLSGLGALALVETLVEEYRLSAEIKWPNDVLVNGKKVAGVLVDVHWSGNLLHDVVIGIGINVHRGSAPDQSQLNFPATSLEETGGKEISRLELLTRVLQKLLKWYPLVSSDSFIDAWQDFLAFKDERVVLVSAGKTIDQGVLQGISKDGSMILISSSNQEHRYHTGEIQLRQVDRS